ncbi:MAG TPA: nuclear transport factor 2 family protein [Gemmatimonadaceae bacterium]|nr:nuclear transport factor 2 family protein [Gemmatimonadaceae bacterium]
MKYALVPLLLLASSAAAQSKDTAVVRKELIAIENEIARANRECDYKYFGRVEADEFIFTTASGAVVTRKEDLAGEKDCKKNQSTTVLDEVVIQLHGNTAVLNARSTVSATGRSGQPVANRTRFTDVFVWRDGRWQLVAGHSSRLQ